MKKNTRKAFDNYAARLAQLNDTGSVGQTFSVDPTIQQKLESKMQESSEFLSKINIIGVAEQEGEISASAFPDRSPAAPTPAPATARRAT